MADDMFNILRCKHLISATSGKSPVDRRSCSAFSTTNVLILCSIRPNINRKYHHRHEEERKEQEGNRVSTEKNIIQPSVGASSLFLSQHLSLSHGNMLRSCVHCSLTRIRVSIQDGPTIVNMGAALAIYSKPSSSSLLLNSTSSIVYRNAWTRQRLGILNMIRVHIHACTTYLCVRDPFDGDSLSNVRSIFVMIR